MRNTRIVAISILWTVLSAPLLCAGDLSTYREFQLGMNLLAVVEQAGMEPSEAKVTHLRPSLIQELNWRPRRVPGSLPEADPLKEILFSFYDGELFRIVVNYDRYKTEGLTAEDLIEALSAKYGTATKPGGEIVFPSVYNESVKIIARWEDSEYSVNLVRSSYQPSFGIVGFSKRLDTLAQAAMTEAIRLDKQEAPQREIESRRKQEDESRLQQERARTLNKPGFRP